MREGFPVSSIIFNTVRVKFGGFGSQSHPVMKWWVGSVRSPDLLLKGKRGAEAEVKREEKDKTDHLSLALRHSIERS